ncbi:peroxidase family protein [Streptomyces violaceusniger]|uniref:peroxidase family protein n=1 Tax=Streptomyces violaceusniger TaxID=68280 RepID=UPI000996C5D6|nr:peroxidase family protein [Streptomyces hygroscopicus]AQW47929.1 peroxidase [Streptomyces hygroscopicus]
MVDTGQQSVRSEAVRGGVAARVGEAARHEATGGTRGATYEGYEAYEGGSPEAERRRFEKLTRELMRTQRARPGGADSPGAPQLLRPFRAKAALGVENARLRFRDDLPPELCVGYARPGAEYPAAVRLSSASGTERHDTTPDLRRMAVRVQAGPEETHDLLATSFPVSHAADVHEFVAFAKATAGAGSTVEKAFGLFVRLPLAVGWATADRMRRNVRIATRHTVGSLARETFWSRGAILWGPAGPVRYQLRPAPGGTAAPPPDRGDPDYLDRELAMRLSTGDIAFELCVQRYLDDRRTPVEDGSVEWREGDAPVVPVAVLTVPCQDLDSARARAAARRVELLAFNPWHTTEEFRPLGNLNRARKAAYEVAAAHRLGLRFPTAGPGPAAEPGPSCEPRPTALLPVPVRAAFGLPVRAAFGLVDRCVPWHRLPDPLGLLNPVALGRTLRRLGLLDAAPPEAPPRPDPAPAPAGERPRVARPYDGPAGDPGMARRDVAGAAVGRRLSPVRRPELIHVPHPATVSGRLLHRERFRPATSLNVLAAAWTHFQSPDWVDATSHRWDGSQVYGGAGPRLEEGHLPLGPGGVPPIGSAGAWWLGLSAMHTLFAREHEAVCEALRRTHPAMDEESVRHTARLVVSALIAKIHTVEWIPAILTTEVIDLGSKTNWQGPPAHWLSRLGLWLFEASASAGGPRGVPDHPGVPFALAEEFMTVYRTHPLVPDDVELCDHRFGRRSRSLGFDEVRGAAAEAVMRKTGLADALYSFGIARPGAITLGNYPRALRRCERDGELLDLPVADLMRARRRGVPRYNDFRARLGRARIRSFEELSPDPDTVARLEEVYASVNEIDTMVGLFAENRPEGAGFSETACHVLLLMATRRIQDDRLLTVDFRPEVYTPLGLDWVEKSSMTSVVLRHCPELAGVLPRGASPFAPWRPVVPSLS